MDDPNGPKCCFCFPLKCGIIFIGVMAVVDLSYEMSRTALMTKFTVVLGILTIPSLLFMFANIIMFVKYCYRDSLVARKHLVVGCSLQIFANLRMKIGCPKWAV